MSLLHVRQMKGDPEALDGRLTVYSRVDIEPTEFAESKHPVTSMIHNGLLVAQGNFKEQYSLRDFLMSEMGLSFEEGLQELLSRLDGIESALDPDKLREKLQEMEGMEEFIPTPAKIVPFHTEDEILAQEGDVFHTGRFRNAGNAVLSVNAFPILYQARYREQVMDSVRSEIDRLVGQIEQAQVPQESYATPDVDVVQRLLRDYIPSMLYSRKESGMFETAERQFRAFMRGYRFTDDVDAIVRVIRDTPEMTSRHYRMLELYARKIAAVRNESFDDVERLRSEIRALEEQTGQ